MAKLRCPVCEQRFDSGGSVSLPFCSERCRLIDLKRWLGEEYSVPHVRNPDEEPDDLPEDAEAPGEWEEPRRRRFDD